MKKLKKTWGILFLGGAILLSGCSGGSKPSTTGGEVASSVTQEQSATKTVSLELTGSDDSLIETTSSSATSDSMESTDAAGKESNMESDNAVGTDSNLASNITKLAFGARNRKTGSFNIDDLLPKVEDITEEESAEMDRAVRAFGGKAISKVLVNRADSFYYYEQLEKEEQKIYDAILTLCEAPDDEDNIVVLKTKLDVEAEEFIDAYTLAYLAVLYDHPELFWLYNGIKTDIDVYYPNGVLSGLGGYSTCYLMFENVYEDFKKDEKAFNEAADDFLSDIDMDASDSEIALAIHDKLVNLVTYDYSMLEEDDSLKNLAHTAYGALVADNDGRENYAVCDGYSQAYVYLCQQAGIPATVIVGEAGENLLDAGNHAWAMVKIDGKWKEVDATWNDTEGYEEVVEMLEDEEYADNVEAQYLLEALRSKKYMDVLGHYLYLVLTDTITEYEPDESSVYTSKDGKVSFSLLEPSIHLRSSELDVDHYGRLMELAPVAK